MIKLTKFTGEEIFINADKIKSIENGADTVLVFITEDRLLVKESAEEIQELFMNYKKEIHNAVRIATAY
ncbi:MAG: hypothetical protein ACI9S8_002172 [Chlamydiales bacterium]|jgi:uncharacterized protein YlzI (FlbEa/FlbD family)